MGDDTALHILRQRPTATARGLVSDSLRRQTPPPEALYIHVPFCFHKCHYCDFYSFVDTRDRQGPFVDRLADELRALAPLTRGQPLRTIFVGGGTPTLLAPEHWVALLGALHEAFSLAEITAGRGEFTVECNPETASAALFDTLVAGGVNRISIGAQSFSKPLLKTLERWHEPESVAAAVELARASGIPHRSVDLIYAIPGQTIETLGQDLDIALALPIDHLSAYNLTYEPNTAMTKRLERGDFDPLDEDTELAMFDLVRERASLAGLHAYEISNFARPGGECRHNLAYWRQEQWIAAGPSASGHVGGHRYKVIPRLEDYLSTSEDGFALITDHEPPDEARLLAEMLMTGIRLSEGVRVDALLAMADRIGAGVSEALRRQASLAANAGWLIERDGRWLLTPAGLPLGDHVAANLMSAVR